MWNPTAPQPIHVVDSHTAGEPTRLILDGGPALGSGSLLERREIFRTRFDSVRTAVLLEPRGSDVLVGGLLCQPQDPRAAAGIIFFNDVGYLGMCGHGMIGLITTLAHLGRIAEGTHLVETPVGMVTACLMGDGSVSVQNVPSYCYRRDVAVEVPGLGVFVGDIAWGGNWFFLVEAPSFRLEPQHRAELLQVTMAIRAALANTGITGADGAVIDHIELFTAPHDPENSSRNFVLCPGAAFDRSPCGTGTSAKLASLHAAGKLKAGEVWRQEGILGTVFQGSFQPAVQAPADGPGDLEAQVSVLPTITGRAYITADTRLLFDPADPFVSGIGF